MSAISKKFTGLGRGIVSGVFAVTTVVLMAPEVFATSGSPNPPNSSQRSLPATEKKPGKPDEALCGTPVLDALKQHKVQRGETLASIAKKYNLTVATIAGLNPQARSGSVDVGKTLGIPPVNGIAYRVGNEESYKSIASKFRLRADVLFEHNGCQSSPKVVFVPGAVWKPDLVVQRYSIAARPAAFGSLPVIIDTGGYPLPYAVPVTSGYGWRTNPVTGDWAFHSGIDLGAPLGTPVLAAKAGRVEYAGWSGGYGNLVELSHNDFGTRYAHLSAIYVSAGQQVKRGQEIGIVGSTGRSTGPHLHFEILVPSAEGWATINPAPYLNRIAFIFTDIVPM